MKLLVKIMYDGSHYCGFQVQPGKVTVQKVLCDAFEQLYGFKCKVSGCSRTDSGVHAKGFCASIYPYSEKIAKGEWSTIPAGKVHRAINVILPDDISVYEAAYVDDDFNVRYDVDRKEYIYKIWDHPWRNPFLFGYSYEFNRSLDEEKMALMQEAAELFLGTHDFKGFMSVGSKVESTIRTVKTVKIYRDYDDTVCFAVSADGFLYNMVRIMAGTLIAVAVGRLTLDDVKEALLTGKRKKAGFTAPPEGLYLNKVYYTKEIDWQLE